MSKLIINASLPLEGIEVMQDELMFVLGGTALVASGGAGCNCGCTKDSVAGSGAGCNCICNTTTAAE